MNERQLVEIIVRPPPGVVFIPHGDGTIHARLIIADADKLKSIFEQSCRELAHYKIRVLEAQKQGEAERRKIPPSAMERIDAELAQRRQEMMREQLEMLNPPQEVITTPVAADKPTMHPPAASEIYVEPLVRKVSPDSPMMPAHEDRTPVPVIRVQRELRIDEIPLPSDLA